MLFRSFPREGKTLRTAVGRERVVSVDIWRERVMLKDDTGNRRTVTLEELKGEVAAAPPEPAGGAEAGRLHRERNGGSHNGKGNG